MLQKILLSLKKLFIVGGKELRLGKRSTQGGPTTMAVYTLGFISLPNHLQSIKRSVKHPAFAEELTDAGKVQNMVTTQSHKIHSL